MTLRGLFRGSDGQYRALWRILAFIGLLMLFDGMLTVLVTPFKPAVDKFMQVEGTVDIVLLTISLLFAHWLMLRRIEMRPWSYVWMDRSAMRGRLLGIGTLVGGLPILAVILVLMAVGWMTIEPALDGSWWAAATKLTTVLALAAFGEELFSRGFILSAMSDGMGRTAAVAVSSILFGLAHLGNPNVTAQPIIMVALAGFELAVVLLALRSLYAATAAHLAWNWVMGVPFHVSISGIRVPQPDYKAIERGPDWITGGPWGPEGGALAAVGMLATMTYLYYRHLRTTPI